jgi:phospholipase/carboxylesterase
MTSDRPPLSVRSGPELLATGLSHNVLQPSVPGPYPTVVMLHGRLGNEEVMWIFRRTIPKGWLMIAPRATMRDPAGGYSWAVQPYGEWPDTTAFDPATDAVSRFIESLPSLYNADPDRIYLMGFSQGAATAFCTALRHPGLVQGIASLVGFVPPTGDRDVTGALDGLPVFMAAGTEDRMVPPDQSHRSRDVLLRAGADLEYHEYDTGHKMTPDSLRDLQAWWAQRL